MSAAERSRGRRSRRRRLERWVVGRVMAVIAFVLERVILRSIRKGEGGAPASPA